MWWNTNVCIWMPGSSGAYSPDSWVIRDNKFPLQNLKYDWKKEGLRYPNPSFAHNVSWGQDAPILASKPQLCTQCVLRPGCSLPGLCLLRFSLIHYPLPNKVFLTILWKLHANCFALLFPITIIYPIIHLLISFTTPNPALLSAPIPNRVLSTMLAQ